MASAPTAEAKLHPIPWDLSSNASQELLHCLASFLSDMAAENNRVSSDPPPSTFPTSMDETLDLHIWNTLTTASQTAYSTPGFLLTFDADNIPSISLEAYLLPIQKYCPNTNEVFVSILVYFDRMSKLAAATNRKFIIDSYNIHRLVIAGVTTASKFLSDICYPNSRWAKVGGLSQPELNELELQFVLLNDFCLVIPRDEMQRYAEQLLVNRRISAAQDNKASPGILDRSPLPGPATG
ncbi:cyclin-domain-containing protein [Mycena galericulata]|nr:cyclin-domain-containing protein [Mycena galericulata]